MANRLAGETSPYLLQHAHNPVGWYPWGPEALARAKAEDKPIFLSIGYAACHWCHVMEHESFEDEVTAAELNANFIPIKVDREERPDLDQVYMAAVVTMTGSGGWPMSVFLTPDGRPFYGGTYFPDTPRHGMPAFRQVLAAVARAWHERRAEIEASGSRLVEALVPRMPGPTSSSRPGPALPEQAVAGLEAAFDPENGGWGRAPKFPQPMTIEFLLRRALVPDARALAMARRTLDRMADGGIHDQLGGGFHRYSTDAAWLVPHFEKMLYDNAQLARVYLHAYLLTGARRDLEVACDTLDYIRRELTTPDGAWAASQDADTGGVEGATFVWTPAEVLEALGEDDGRLFAAAYGVRAGGNWEGCTILSRVRSDDELAAQFGRPAAEVREQLAAARAILLERRNARPQPARDDKVLAAWNGLALGAFADASTALACSSDPALAERGRTWGSAATRAAEVLLARLRRPDGRLGRSWKDGRLTGQGVLEDYTHLAEGLLALYEATADESWFVAARELMEIVLEHFAAPAGGFFDTADDHEPLLTRPRDLQDNALPSGNTMAATVFLRLASLTGEGRYRTAAEQAISLVGADAARHPTAFGQWLVTIDFLLARVVEVAIVGDPADLATQRLLVPARTGFRPHQVVAVGPDPARSAVPLLQGRFALHARPTAFVCREFSCRQPVDEPEALRALLLST